jgi:hypothetical protein
MKGDRVEAVVDTGQGTRTFEITASRAGRRLEVTTGRGIVEVTEVTRHGTPVRTGRFMANRLIALVEHPAIESGRPGVDVSTRRRLGGATGPSPAASVARRRDVAAPPVRDRSRRGLPPATGAADEGVTEPDPADELAELERIESAGQPDPLDEPEPVEA